MVDGALNTPPDVSVVVPVYNDPEGLHSLIPALVDQSFHNDRYEILIVDNNSTDETSIVLNRFANEFPTLIRSLEENQIQSSYAARNRGIEKARGEIIAFTDADCLPCEQWLSGGIQAFENSAVSLAAGRVDIVFENEEPNIWEFIDASFYLDQQHFVENAGYGATANLFARRELFERYGMFWEHLQSGGDNEFGRRITKQGEKLIYLDEAVVQHRARSRFTSLLKREIRVARGIGMLYDQGVLDWNPRSPSQFLPRIRFSRSNVYDISFSKYCLALLTYNILHYINLLNRF